VWDQSWESNRTSSKTGKKRKLFSLVNTIWAAPWQNQHNVFATSMDPDQPAYLCSLIRIHAVRLQTP
jgi:hypothetical protein